jgi:NADH:ubiquinone oxidoreductase subunit 3 (subunit A)
MAGEFEIQRTSAIYVNLQGEKVNTLKKTVVSKAVVILTSLLSEKNIEDREKRSSFECGFDPKRSPRLPLSLRFF